MLRKVVKPVHPRSIRRSIRGAGPDASTTGYLTEHGRLVSRGSGCASERTAPRRLLSEHAQHVRGSQRLCDLRSRHVVLQHLLLYDRKSDPVLSVRSAREFGGVRDYAACMIAPSGTVPLVTYRQSAIVSLRATATIPMRRARLPRPKRFRNHRVSALWGCHRTHVQAS